MCLVWLMWTSAFDPKSVFRRSSQLARREERLSRSEIKSVELNWVKRRTAHEPNWLNWVRLMWSTAFDPGLTYITAFSSPSRSARASKSSTNKIDTGSIVCTRFSWAWINVYKTVENTYRVVIIHNEVKISTNPHRHLFCTLLYLRSFHISRSLNNVHHCLEMDIFKIYWQDLFTYLEYVVNRA